MLQGAGAQYHESNETGAVTVSWVKNKKCYVGLGIGKILIIAAVLYFSRKKSPKILLDATSLKNKLRCRIILKPNMSFEE